MYTILIELLAHRGRKAPESMPVFSPIFGIASRSSDLLGSRLVYVDIRRYRRVGEAYSCHESI